MLSWPSRAVITFVVAGTVRTAAAQPAPVPVPVAEPAPGSTNPWQPAPAPPAAPPAVPDPVTPVPFAPPAAAAPAAPQPAPPTPTAEVTPEPPASETITNSEPAAPPAPPHWSATAEVNLSIPRAAMEAAIRTSRGLRLIGERRVLPAVAVFVAFDIAPLLNQPSVPDSVSVNYYAVHAGARIGRPNPDGWAVRGLLGLGYEAVSGDMSLDASGLGFLLGASIEYPLPQRLIAGLSLTLSSASASAEASPDVELSFWTLGAGVSRAF